MEVGVGDGGASARDVVEHGQEGGMFMPCGGTDHSRHA